MKSYVMNELFSFFTIENLGICKHEVFWDLKHKQCMHHIVNDNLLRYVNDIRLCFDYKHRYLNNKFISLVFTLV